MYAVRPSFRTPHQPLRKGRRAICRVVIEAPIQLGTAPGQRWVLTAALNIIFVMKHLLFPSKKGAPAMCWSYGPVPRIKRSKVLCGRPRPSGRETLYISAQEGMKPPGINPLTGPHLRDP